MDFTLAFILAMPVITALLLAWMIASGYGRTKRVPARESPPNPYPERLDTLGRWLVAIGTVALYAIAAWQIGPRAAAIMFAFLLLVDVVGALIWTVLQQVLSSREAMSPFGSRLFRNIRDFYLNLIVGLLAFA